VLAELKMSVGDSVDMTVLDGKLTIQGIRRHPREGWAEEARLIAAEEQVDSEWLDFPNDRDDTLTW
jgi:antitoxin MazE